MKSGNLNFLEPPGPLQGCNGTALPFRFYWDRLCSSSFREPRQLSRYRVMSTGWKTKESVLSSRQEIFLCPKLPRGVLGTQQPPIQCLRTFLDGSKAIETWNWSFTSIQSYLNAWSYFSTPLWLFMIRSLINRNENLILTSVLTSSFHPRLSVLNKLFFHWYFPI
jgi:hypothetical protein